MGTPSPDVFTDLRKLVDEYRDRCLWYLRPDSGRGVLFTAVGPFCAW